MAHNLAGLLVAGGLVAASSVAAQDASVDLTAAGNEPFWRVEVSAGNLTLMRPDFPALTLSVTDRTEAADGTLTVSAASSSPAMRAILTLRPGPCADTMADQTYPFEATVEMGDIVLNGCGGDPRDLLTATEVWTVTEIQGSPTVAGTEAEIGFSQDSGVFGSGGCNRLSGAYELTGEGVSLGPIAATRMACPGEIMSQEQRLITALESVFAFDIGEAGDLILLGPDGPAVRATAAP